MAESTSKPHVAAQPTITAEQFSCDVHSEGRGAAWISLRGELDIATTPRFGRAVNDALNQALLVVVDLRELTFIDSIGLCAILNADRRARATGHRLVLIRGSGQVARLFELVGFTDRLKVVDLTSDIFTTSVLSIRDGEVLEHRRTF